MDRGVRPTSGCLDAADSLVMKGPRFESGRRFLSLKLGTLMRCDVRISSLQLLRPGITA
jgi:hypothetical protein